MKKMMGKLCIFAATAMLAESALADALWLGNSYIEVNGTWFQAHGTEAWADGGAFDGHDFGVVTNLEIGGQLQIGDNGADWNGGSGDWMHYYIDDIFSIEHVNLAYESYGHGQYNNMRFQSGGGAYATASVDLSGLSVGPHTLTVFFGPVDEIYEADQTVATPYTASFTVAAFPYAGQTEAGDYTISTFEQLRRFEGVLHNEDGENGSHFKDAAFTLAADIDCGGQAFVPPTNRMYAFKGTFDGAGHRIFNFTNDTAGCGSLVGVMLDTMRQVESHLVTRHYDGFLRKGHLRSRR